MAFVDEITLHAKAGNGGNGVVRWRHEKGKEYAGPSGGDGGKGGDVYARGVRDIGLLAKYRHTKEFKAGDGGSGMSDSMHGKNGDDLEIALPLGSVITRGNEKFEILDVESRLLLLRGGRGGYGNERFKGPENQRPEESTPGREGEEADLYIELELIVDAGFVGLPNAGKTSLLNALTRANAKVGSYAFTTLEPNLGDFYGYILADIPGLIEDAASGKGLGHKFLRHIKRTKHILHCVSLEEKDPLDVYTVVRKELEAYGEGLPEKQEIIVLTKSDTREGKEIEKIKKMFSKLEKQVFVVSILNDAELKVFEAGLTALLRGSA